MYTTEQLASTLNFDIETIPDVSYNELSEAKINTWTSKYHPKFLKQELEFRQNHSIEAEPTVEEIYIKYCPLIAEYGRIWCISFGYYDDNMNPIISTLQSNDETEMIKDFLEILHNYSNLVLSGYNISEFDIPYILKRMWINGIFNYPKQLQLKGAKPWSTSHVDLMTDWKSLSYQSVSLDVVCNALGIQTPKDKFQNYEFTTLLCVGKISVKDGIEYCEKDVRACMLSMLKLVSDKYSFSPTETKTAWKKKS